MRNCRIIDFKEHKDQRGGLIAIENSENIPFDIERIYYIYDVPSTLERGFHSHKDLEQILIALNGNIKIRIKDGTNEEIVTLDSPNKGLFIGNMIWREMFDFSEGSVLLVLANHKYNPDDYIKDYQEYVTMAREYFSKEDEIQNFLSSDNFVLKPVEVEDAEFLYQLRINENLNRHISPVTGDVNNQIAFINKYKIKEYQKKEYYFSINTKEDEKLGFVRLYNIDYENKVLTFGSFILKEDHPKLTALETMILAVNLAFYYLGMEKVELDVRVKNEHAKNFYKRFGYRKVSENDLDEFYELTKEEYEKLYKEKYCNYVRRIKK